ncbi:hypothetical protein QBC40DRAFT_276236 [Triangularia verruculosa]|uniref:Uncharacterized protein n=1 Tax=Triangularia verruculosa TaxID=2587418 RepID=A0AAN6XKZ1_9PEZI|nr:hypothetical protein QBC40DRAFT_276236 [Triangularia verruculosa]
MSSTAAIPRFLLPQRGLIWKRLVNPSNTTSPIVLVRFSSTNQPSQDGKPIVLEKPERFVPPSHGSRLPGSRRSTLGDGPRHYGGDLSESELKVQARKEYPGTPPPEGSWAHWFFSQKWVHITFTLGTLTALTIWTFTLNYKHNTPFGDMLPPMADFFWHPVSSTRALVEVIRLNEAHNTARIQEKRRKLVEDVAKRTAYRKAHGLPEEHGIFGLKKATVDADQVFGTEGEKKKQQVVVDDASPIAQEPKRLTDEQQKEMVGELKKKWLGIF